MKLSGSVHASRSVVSRTAPQNGQQSPVVTRASRKVPSKAKISGREQRRLQGISPSPTSSPRGTPEPNSTTPSPSPTSTTSTYSSASQQPAAAASSAATASSQQPEIFDKVIKTAEGVLDVLQERWQAASDSEKPAAIAIIIASIVAQVAIGATVDAVDRIPVIGSFLEIVGLAVTGVYAYRFATDPSESIIKSIARVGI